LIGVLLVLTFIKERKTKGIYKGFSMKDLSRDFRLFLFLSAVFALGSFSYSFLLVYAKEFGFETTFIPVFYLVFTVIASLMSLPFGKLADKIGRKIVMVLSYVFFGLMCLGFVLVRSFFGIPLLFILYGLHLGAMEPVQRTFVSELSPVKYRASSIGAYKMVVGLCALPASLIAGLLWEGIDKFAPFYFSLGLTAVSIILILFVKE